MYQPNKAHLASQVLLERVKEMKLLEELSLKRFHISEKEQGEAFLEVCQRLKVLELGRVQADVVIPSQIKRTQGLGQETKDDNEDSTEPFTLPRLRKLILDRVTMDIQQQLALWKASTHLEDLTWVYRAVAPEFEFPIAEICNHLAHPSSLSAAQSLTRLNIKSNSISDQDFSRLLDLLPNLEAFSANLSRFGPLALATLLGEESPKHEDNSSVNYGKATTATKKRRAHQWKELSLANCQGLRGLDFQKILTSCPSLKVFAGGPIYINQLVSQERLLSITISTLDLPSPESKILANQDSISLQDRPWVCLGLENLDIQLFLCTQEEPLTGAVPARDCIDMRIRRGIIYNRLATLTRLKVLSLNTIISITPSSKLALIEEEQGIREFGLDMSLRYEMARLAPLKKLQQLNLSPLESELQTGEQDFRWMEKAFPELVAVLGPFEKVRSNLGSLRYHVGLL
ncbi:hypothetical protein EC991_002131 [Linnemannia zychae]|nr:hypothetical protein EC991_002131 [Linnemannia zychae]